jgi:hypothetical protein
MPAGRDLTSCNGPVLSGTKRLGRSTLMSFFQSMRHERSSPDRLGSTSLAEDRAWQGAALKTTVEQTLIRGLATAGPCSVSGLPRSRSGTSVTGPIVDHEGSPPCAAPGHARSCSGVRSALLLAGGLGGWSAQAVAPLGWTCHAIAQAKAAISRATAVVTRLTFLPFATSRRKRAHSRT